MTPFFEEGLIPALDSAARIWGSDNPPRASPPTFRKLRRVRPSQNRPPLPCIVSITTLFYGLFLVPVNHSVETNDGVW